MKDELEWVLAFILHPSSFRLHPSAFILHPSSLILSGRRVACSTLAWACLPPCVGHATCPFFEDSVRWL